MDNTIYEMPPRLTGTTEEKLRKLEEYLTRLVMKLNEREKK